MKRGHASIRLTDQWSGYFHSYVDDQSVASVVATRLRSPEFKAIGRATGLAVTLLLATAGCAPVAPYHPGPHTGHPATTNRGDGHGSTMPSADQTGAGGVYQGQGGQVSDHQQHGLDRGSQSYGGAGYGTGAYGHIR
jgi:hypothetical protein